jgi:FkbM family methyltransferase
MSIYLIVRSTLKIQYGSFDEELTEQKLSCKYILPTDTVLEIGGNMGRNALIISSILKDDKQFVTMEPNPEFYTKLVTNRNINNKKFNIENSALSLHPLFCIDSLTSSNDTLSEKFPLSKDHINKNTHAHRDCSIISFSSLEDKYDISFNVLVIDCEGAFYYILKDMPYILHNIRMIIMENDYENKDHYEYIYSTLVSQHFTCIESIPLPNCPWNAPCKDNFYEVWKR